MSNKEDDNINKLVQELKTKCFDSVKCQNKLEDIIRDIEKVSKAELSELKETFDDKIEEESDLYDHISELGQRIANFNGNKNAIEDVQSKSSELINKNEAVHKKIKQLKQTFDSKVPASKSKDKYEEEERRNDDSGNNSFLMEKLIVQNVQKNEEVLKKRRADLDDAKVVAGQIKGIAQEMKFEVMAQGDKLNIISDNVMEINENATKAEKEIKKADELAKSSRNRTCCIIFIIAFVVAAVVTLIVVLTIL